MLICLFNQVAQSEDASDAKRPEMINSADQKSCRVAGCIKAKTASSVVKRPLGQCHIIDQVMLTLNILILSIIS